MKTYWALRIGAALCFIGHGAFGFITKAAWVPYFAVAGIREAWAWKMMPIVGAIDVLVGMSVLFAPRRLALGYMAGWALWTAMLRPLAGESVFELLERAGNYGVPFALLVMAGFPRNLSGWFDEIRDIGPRTSDIGARMLQWTTVLLLVGHGALGVMGKPMLTSHYASIGFGPETTAIVGWFELALAAAVAARPSVGLMLFVAAWKLCTESLFFAAGAPIWEFVERAGSYAAPLALAFALGFRLPSSAGIADGRFKRIGLNRTD